MHNLPGYSEALKVRDKYQSARAKALASLESYVDGTQYAGLPDWFSDDKPLWERAPCIVYPIVRCAIDSNGDLLLGEGRFPDLHLAELEGDEAAGESAEQALNKLIQQSRLKAAAREVFAAGQGCGSACAIFGVRAGRLFIDTVRAAWCEPVLDAEGAVLALTIAYPYLVVEQTSDGEKVVCMLYRRQIDASTDVTYLPARGNIEGAPPSWRKDPARTFTHGLGFCPVVWFPHMKGCQVVNDFDGRAIHEHLTDEIRAHDFALSQRHRAALYAGDPQWTEIGVDPGFNPTGTGRRAELPSSVTGRPGETFTGAWVSEPSPGKKARKKSPGTVWQYPTQDASKIKVELHTLPGDALAALESHARDLRAKIAESLGIVFVEPEALPNESRISGQALEWFRAPQLARVDFYRSDFGDKFLLPALGMLIRIAQAASLQIPGLDTVTQAIAGIGEAWSWHAPAIELVWGDYFKPNGQEELFMLQAAAQAKDSGIATTKILVQKLRTVLGIKDIDSYLKELETEKAAEVQKQQDQMATEAKIAAQNAPKPAPSPSQ